MSTILLIIIYICYIGLGVPDSLLGTAWPAIYVELHTPVSYVSSRHIIHMIYSSIKHKRNLTKSLY